MTKLPMSIKETSIFCQLSFLHICTLMRPEAWQGPGSKLDAENFYKIFLHHSLVFVRSWNIKTHYGQTNYSSKHLLIVSKYSTSQTPQKTNEISTSQKYIANFPFRETKDQVIFHFFLSRHNVLDKTFCLFSEDCIFLGTFAEDTPISAQNQTLFNVLFAGLCWVDIVYGFILLQSLRWRCVECVIHHERDVREEQHPYIRGANKQ